MKRFLPFYGVIPLLLFAIASCKQEPNHPLVPESVDGWVPVYGVSEVAYTIKSAEPRAIKKGGKIYTKGTMLYQIEENEGIHAIDISTPSAPKKVKFIAIKGVQEMAIKNNYLYANNLNDLVILDISDLNDVKTASRVGSAFHVLDQNVPPTAGYYECIDASKGIVIGWERKTLNHPECVKY